MKSKFPKYMIYIFTLSQMSYELQLYVPSQIAPRVMGKFIEIEDEKSGVVTKHRETIYNLMETYNVSIDYNRKQQNFTVSGNKINVDKVVEELENITEKINAEQEEFYERKKEQRARHQDYLHREKKRAIYKAVKEAEAQQKSGKKKVQKNGPIIDRKNIYHLLEIEDDDEYTDLLKINNDYEERKKTLEKCNKRMEKKIAQLHSSLKKKTPKDEESEKVRNDTIDELNKLQKMNDKIKFKLSQSLDDYKEYLLNGPVQEPEEEEETLPELDEVTEEDFDNDFINNTEPINEECNVDRSRSAYQKKQYKNKNDNYTKSETWVYSRENNSRDRRRHNYPGNRRHNPQHFDDREFEDEMTNSRQLPTDRLRDKLGELIGINDKSEFPPIM